MPRMRMRRGWGRDEPFEWRFKFENDNGQRHEQIVPWSKVTDLPFHQVDPVRKAKVYQRQRHFPSMFWSVCTGRMIECESWAERNYLMLQDFDGGIDVAVGQPGELRWHNPDMRGGVEKHSPDFLFISEEGQVKIANVRTRPPDEEHTHKFAVMTEACALHGWTHELWTGEPEILLKNVDWLLGYRRQLHPRLSDLVPTIIERCLEPIEIWQLEDAADNARDRVLTRPIIFHLLWHKVLATVRPLHERLLCEQTAVRLSTVVPLHPGGTHA